MTSLSPFELVSQNLLSIGALSIDDFLASRYEPVVIRGNGVPSSSGFPDGLDSIHNIPIASGSKAKDMASPGSIKSTSSPHTTTGLAQLHAICLHQFGQFVKTLKFEFLEEAINKKQCILTITRPDGSTRSYKTEPEFHRKTDAKAQAATIAIEHGAIDFIVHGDSDELKAKKGVLLAPLEDDQPLASTSKLSSGSRSEPETPTVLVGEIDKCCLEWRGDQVKPYWLDFQDSHILTNHGAVLKIQLAPHCWHVYSCQPTCDSPSEAREHCAELAIDEGVLEFIKHGNGQTAPKSDLASSSRTPFELLKHDLQSFYESLPRPFAEPFEEKTATEINAPGWLGNLLANAKGARFTAEFYPLAKVDDRPVLTRSKVAPTKLWGCLLRLNRPGECQTYLAEPQFLTQKDAKAAVSLLALSLGAGKWIREVTSAVEARVTPEMRRFAQTTLFPKLSEEAQRASGLKPRFECHMEGDAFGCKLEVNIKPPSQGNEWARRYEVPAEYRSKPDAKIGVLYLAVQQGVIDLIRNDGEPLLPGQLPAFSVDDGGPRLEPNPTAAEKKANKKRKKKNNDGGESAGPPAKRQKKASANLPPKPGGRAPGSASLPQKPAQDLRNNSRVRHTEGYFSYNPAPRSSDAGDSREHRSPSLEEGEWENE
ncbi:hypothetical protein B0H12DRAFT_1329442 [Mycena haematopus]|nr:hypothetical protein B0H12DRAFT_1329442 [Mycena haematopus]